ncbi:TetR/AcrR family transcriptional regulator [Pseudoclavibacter sp. 8L]|uniref:TetR/AcrR family transcriptional regulator n=1 Tax=Pseudoclavibacter sp. 8L TaxID=2653162 RepID=UPI0012F1D644|nr:TetR/AcrR family transcriptional regulator [Pseudoclavibacter sp. 8L]VXB83755.1 conserved hypothetical protein [Pseudoclavibacter sp. 8L]
MAARTGGTRTAIIEAGSELIAELGYAGATTARICARSGVSSGTFFHHFPTKLHLLVGILEADAAQSRTRFAALAERAPDDPRGALLAWLDLLLEEASDPHLAGFVAGLSAAPSDQRVEQLLEQFASRQQDTLEAIITAGQRERLWRSDITGDRLALWVGVIADGVLTRSVEDTTFDASGAADELHDLIRRYLAP